MYLNKNFIETIFKSNTIDVTIDGETKTNEIDDATPIFLREITLSPSNLFVTTEAALLSIIFVEDESGESGGLVIFCNARYKDLKDSDAFNNLKVTRYIDTPDNVMYSFGAIRTLVAGGEFSADKNYNYNIGIITTDSNGKCYPLNDEICDLTGVRMIPGEKIMTLVYSINDIAMLNKAIAEHGAVTAEDMEPVVEGANKVIDATDKFNSAD